MASEFVEELLRTCGWLADLPKSGTARPEMEVRRLRSVLVHPFTLFYRPMAYGIEVNRVLHQRMDAKREYARRRKRRGKPGAARSRRRKAG